MHRTQRYRILIIDGDAPLHDYVAGQLRAWIDDGQLELISAHSEAEALRASEERFVDLILLDVGLGSPANLRSLDVFRSLERRGISADVILMSSVDLRQHAAELLRMTSTSRLPHVVDFVSKAELRDNVAGLVEPYIRAHLARRINLIGLDEHAPILLNRRDRYPPPDDDAPGRLRTSDEEVLVELVRLCSDLFAQTSNGSGRTHVSVELRELGRVGLSAAITLRPLVRLTIDNVAARSEGYDCVLKVGPVRDITQEYERYRDYVRYGVRLEQRVELQAYAARDAIAGIVYSFAGGVYGDDLVSLDELLEDGHDDIARKVVTHLLSTKYWYAVPASPALISKYVVRSPAKNLDWLQDNYRTWSSLARDATQVVAALPPEEARSVPTFRVFGKPDHNPPSVLEFSDGFRLELPSDPLLSTGWSFKEFPHCLVHGDMHGGNVLVELSTYAPAAPGKVKRVCLIDHRHSGPGPRCIDAAALEWSIRLADAETIERDCGVKAERDVLASPAMIEAIRLACGRAEAERALFGHLWKGGVAPEGDRWTRLSAHVVQSLEGTFADDEPVSWEEYTQTMVWYAVRQAGRPLRPVVRARLCAWLSAQFSVLPAD